MTMVANSLTSRSADQGLKSGLNPPVFVLSVFDTGLAVLRLLAQRGIWVEGFDHVAENAGFATRRATTHFVPEPENATEGLLRQIARRVETLNRGKAVLIPASDYYVQWICDHADELARHAIWLLPPVPTTRLILKKDSQMALAAKAGLRVPWTLALPHTLTDKEFLDLTADVPCRCQYPFFLKPVTGHLWAKHFVGKGTLVRSSGELRRAFSGTREAGVDTVLQEVIPGAPSQNYEVSYYADRSGALSRLFVMRKMRQEPPDFGTACYGITEGNEQRVRHLRALVERWIAATGYRGIGNTEFKWDQRSNDFIYIETNPRVWQQVDLAASAGQNFPMTLYSDVTGLSAVQPGSGFKPGLCWSDPIRDAHALVRAEDTALSRIKGALWTWPLATLRASCRGAFQLSDVGPGLKTMDYGARVLRGALGLLRRVLGLRTTCLKEP